MAARFPMAVVVNGSPLTITIEGASAVVAAEDFVGGLATDDRVQAAFLGDRLVVFARAGGNGPNPNLLINSNFAVNQRAYVSGTDLALNAYGLDMWKATTATSRMTFTAAPQGQTVTIAAGDSFGQVVERADILAVSHTLSWEGTSQARVYNVGGSPPSYAASPITATLDGSANVLVEYGPGTLVKVKLERGTVATPYTLPHIGNELAACQRYCLAFIAGAGSQRIGGWGVQFGTTGSETLIITPVTMRAIPTITFSDLWWTDAVGFNSIVSAIEARYPTTPAASPNGLPVVVTFATAGAARYPGTLAAQASGSYLILDAGL